MNPCVSSIFFIFIGWIPVIFLPFYFYFLPFFKPLWFTKFFIVRFQTYTVSESQSQYLELAFFETLLVGQKWLYFISIPLKKHKMPVLIFGGFQASFFYFLFIFSFPPKDPWIPSASFMPSWWDLDLSTKVLEGGSCPASDYLVYTAELTCVFFLFLGHFITAYLNSCKGLTLLMMIHSMGCLHLCHFSNSESSFRGNVNFISFSAEVN